MFSYFGFLNKSNDKEESKNEITNKTMTTTRINQQEEIKPDEIENQEEEEESTSIFPALNSIQRSNNQSKKIFNVQPPDDDDDYDDYENDINLNNLSIPHSTLKKPKKNRKKVSLMPGFSQLDWAKLTSSGINLRGEEVTNLRRITKSELSKHKTKEDAWSSFNGKVYNITAYLNYHPGGVVELMRVAGKDGTELFMKTHAWISFDSMLDSCLLGFLVLD